MRLTLVQTQRYFEEKVPYVYSKAILTQACFALQFKRLAFFGSEYIYYRQKAVDGDYVFPGRHGGHKTVQNNQALEAAFG
jgi:hypothetical protein